MRRKLFESFQSALAERGLDPNQILGDYETFSQSAEARAREFREGGSFEQIWTRAREFNFSFGPETNLLSLDEKGKTVFQFPPKDPNR